MKYLLTLCLSLSFLPLELLDKPAPMTISTFIIPIAIILIGVKGSKWVILAVSALGIGFVITLISAAATLQTSPIVSYFGFIAPISGLFLGLSIANRPDFFVRFIQTFWIPGAIFAIALVVSVIQNDGVVRGIVLTENDFYGSFAASTALASLFGLKMFATFGINSFAGICLAIVFVLCLSLTMQNRRLVSKITILSIAVLITYGSALQSRSFFLGLVVFFSIFLIKFNGKLFLRMVVLVVGGLFVGFVVLQDKRILLSISQLAYADIDLLTSNRSALWKLFFQNFNPIWGSGFGPLLTNSPSSSFHLYVLTLLAKGGFLFGLPILMLLLTPLFKKYNRHSLGNSGIVVKAAYISFLVQSLFWDIFAVQLYGHIAWMFVGVSLINGQSLGQSSELCTKVDAAVKSQNLMTARSRISAP